MNSPYSDFFFNRTDFEKRHLTQDLKDCLSPQNMNRLLQTCNLPQQNQKIIHVAGTNGKGSLCFFIEQLLLAMGFSTGTFLSPHLVSINERFRIDGYNCPDNDLKAAVEEIQNRVPDNSNYTAFEMLFLTAMILFKQKKTDYTIIETGVGGKLDTTNCLFPELTVITKIGLDHQSLLGNTLQEIALQKAGIMRKDTICITTTEQTTSVKEVLSSEAEYVGARLIYCSPFKVFQTSEGSVITIDTGEQFTIKMRGNFQGENLSMACHALAHIGLQPTTEHFSLLNRTTLPARNEMFTLPDGKTILLDCAHNPDAVTALIPQIEQLPGPTTLIFGALQDKKPEKLLKKLHPYFDLIILTLPASPRAAQPDQYGPAPLYHNFIPDPVEAYSFALKNSPCSGSLVVAGSFYLTGTIHRLLQKELKGRKL